MSGSQPSAKSVAAILMACALAVPGIAAFEGYVPRTYRDTNGKLTYCYGNTNGAMAGRDYTPEQCAEALAQAVVDHALPIARCLPDELPSHTSSAFIRIGYNLGAAKFCASSMSKLAMSGDLKGACAAISLYQFSGGKDCRKAGSGCAGIPLRRASERAECELGLAA